MRHLGELAEILRKRPFAEKLKAITELKSIRTPEAASILITGLYDPDTRVRKAVSEALVFFGSISLSPLLSALKTTDRSIRRNIALILGEMAEKEPGLVPKIEEILINCLKDPDPIVKAQACENLGKMGSKRATPQILPLLTDVNFWVRSLACLVLGDLGLDEVKPLLERLSDVNHWVRASACEALGKLGAKAGVEKISEMSLLDESEVVRDSAIAALKTLGEVFLEPYKRVLRGANIQERLQAMAVLQKIGEPAVPFLLKLLESKEDEDLKSAVCATLGQIGDIRAVDPLINLLRSGNPDLQVSAINALVHLKTESVVRTLTNLLAAPDPALSDGAKITLEKMGEYPLPFLIPELTNYDPAVRRRICEILGNIGSEKATDALLKRLSDENPWVRATACEALGKIGDKRIIPYLLVALKDNFPLMRAKACEALGRLCTPYGLEGLIARLRDDDLLVKIAAIKALTEIGGERVKPVILEKLKDEDIEVRIAAIQSLFRLEAIETLPLLEKIAQPWPFSNEDPSVKEEAKRVAKRFKEIIARRRGKI